MRLAACLIAFVAVSTALAAPATSAKPATAKSAADTSVGPGLSRFQLDWAPRLEFAAPMVTWAGGADDAPVRLVPEADCAWWWEDDTTLACRPRDPTRPLLKQATRYRVEVGAGLWTQSGEAFAPSWAEADHARPALEADASWNDAAVPRIELSAPRGVESSAIEAVLALHFNGRPLRYRLEPLQEPTAGTDSRWRVHPEALPGTPGTLVLSTRDGLRSDQGPLRGEAQPALLAVMVDEPFGFAGASCGYGTDAREPPVCAADQPIRLRFTRTLSEASLAAIAEALPVGVALAPPGDYCSDCWREGRAPLHPLAIVASPRTTPLQLRLPAGLTATDGSVLATPVDVTLTITDPPAAYRIAEPVRVTTDGGPAAPVEARNVRHRDQWVELSIGADIERRETTLAPDPTRNLWAALGVPEPMAWLARGGVSIGGPRERWGVSRATVVAPFQLLAWTRPGALLAWASEWRDAAPVPRTRVELLRVRASGRVDTLAEGRGDRDGLARLAWDAAATAAQDWTDPALLLLRARAGSRTTVTPLESANVPMTGGWRPTPPMELTFGVTERLLYRPGDTVSFRLWIRHRDDNRLAADPADTPVPLVLTAQWQEPLLEWKDETDAFGGIAGEITLPAATPDGQYCIRPETQDEDAGACFQVARFQAQSLWAALEVDRTRVRPGDTVVLDAAGGFYSGGAAANAGVRFGAFATGQDFAQAFPQYAEFAFARADGDAEVDLLGHLAVPARLDPEGKLRLEVPMPAQLLPAYGDAGPLPFARLRFNAYVAMPGEPEVAGPTAMVDYAAFPAYVGLRSDGWWLGMDADPVLEAVVVSAEGEARPGAPVQVRIERVDDARDADGDDTPPAVAGRCALVAGTKAPCQFRAPEPGLYRFIAEAGDAAPVTMLRWIGHAPPPADDGTPVQLTLAAAAAEDQPARVRIQQPHPRATALLVLESGALRAAWTQAIDDDAEVEVPLQPAWAPAATLRVVVRPHAASDAEALAAPTLQASLDLDVPHPAPVPPVLRLGSEALQPGQAQTITLRNDAAVPRQFVVAVVDDSLHQQAAGLHALLDPQRESFIGSLRRWTVGTLHDPRLWRPRNLFFDHAAAARAERFERGETDEADAASAPVVAPAPPAPPPPVAGDTTIDSIEVTGSRLKRADIEPDQVAGDVLPTGERGDATPDPRVRHRFADAAYWNDGLVLAPGESREITLPLPDNLTRWRVLAWAADPGGDFGFAQATFTAALPVELRLGLPARMFTDDRGAATVSVRAVGAPAVMALHAEADGAGVAARLDEEVRGAADAVVARVLGLAPARAGEIRLYARADADAGSDAIAGRVPVLDTWAPQSRVQAGWMQPQVSLPLPELPAGARDPRLSVGVSLGGAQWRQLWIEGLRDYPHRCWEQQLSRAIGAAFALQDDAGRQAWPDAQATLDAVLASAPQFRDEDGWYHFFADTLASGPRPSSLLLSAHTLRGFSRLQALGVDVPEALTAPLVERVEHGVARAGDFARLENRYADETFAIAVAALAATGGDFDPAVLARLWSRWEELGWHARSELVRALAATPGHEAQAAEGLARLREAGRDQGLRRVLADPRPFGWAMGSLLRDQCAVTATLFELDHDPAHRGRRQAFLRGTADLYAGAAARNVDTQAAQHCLWALHAARAEGDAVASAVEVRAGAARATLAPTPAAPHARWDAPAAAGPVQLEAADDADATLSFVARLDWQQDLRSATPEAIGMQLVRRYAVLRDGDWAPLANAPSVQVGDWIRVTLAVDVPAARHFVALTDTVPGGWVSRDVTLAGGAGDDLRRIAAPGSWWFDSRQTGANEVRMYAQWLPPGRHEVHYFVQATHAGTWFAPPARAELMYGEASRAGTAPAVVEVRDR